MSVITIIGGGKMGSNLAEALKDSGLVRVWDMQSDRRTVDTIEEAIADTEAVIVCIPSWHVKDAVRPLVDMLPAHVPIVTMSKGVDSAGLTVDRVLSSLFPPEQPLLVLGGPLLAEEVGKQRSGVGVIASPDRNARTLLHTLLEPTGLYFEEYDDSDSVAIAGALKNIFTLFMGMVGALEYGDNLKGYFLSCCVDELLEIGYELGGDEQILRGTAGLGDFFATSMSTQSLNVSVGQDWVRQGKSDRQSEGSVSARPVWNLLGDTAEDFPILGTIVAILDGEPAAEAVADLLP